MDDPDAAVADAGAWLARQGIAVPEPVRPTGAAGREGSRSRPSQDDQGQDSDRGRRGIRGTRGDSDARGGQQARGGRGGQRARGERDDGPGGEGEADPYEVARSIALRKLMAQHRTRHELAKAMQARNVPAEVAEEVLGRLEEVGLVNDAAFAEAWVESRQQRRHLSRPALRRELQAKGVDRDGIDAALESVDFGDELRAARDLAHRRHASLAGQPYQVRYRRLAGVLSRRGFGTAVVTQVLREVLPEAELAGDVLDPDLDRT